MLVFSGSAMAVAMALPLFCLVVFLGGVNPLLMAPGLGGLLAAGFWAGVMCFQADHEYTYWNSLDSAIAAFVAYSIGRYFSSSPEYEARNELIQILSTALSYFVASRGVRNREGRRMFLYALAFFAFFQASLSIWQAFTKSDSILVWERPELYNGRGSGTFVCPNHLAGFLEMCLGLMVARIAIARREGSSTERSVLLKVFFIYIAIMIAIGILTSLSRAGWVAAMGGMMALLFLGGWKRNQALSRLGTITLIFVCVVGVLWSLEPIRNYLIKTVQTGAEGKVISLGDPTMGGRTMMWSGTVDIIRQNPWFGTGMGSWQWVYQKVKDYRLLSFPEYTHNDYLNLASDYGLVGVCLLIIVFVFFFRHAGRVIASTQSSEDRAFAAGAIASVISILIHSWFDFNLHIPSNSAFLAAIMGMTSGITLSSPKSSQGNRWGRFAVAGVMIFVSGILLHFCIPTIRAFQVTRSGDVAKYDLDYETAIATYAHASEIDPRYAKPFIRSGDIFRDQLAWRVGPGKLRERRDLAQKAVESYDRALALNGHLSDVWLSRGRALEQVGSHEEALESYLKAIEVAPVSAFAHFVLGQFHRERGQPGKAVEYFEKANRYFLYNDPMFQVSQWYEKEKLNATPKAE